jgi:hypothetical protein
VLALGVITLGGCHPPSRPRPRAAQVAVDPSAAVRALVRRYLDHMLAGRYGRAWELLVPTDRRTRSEYVEAWRSTDSMRLQLAKVQRPTYRIGRVRVRDHAATAIVTLRTFLGVSRLRFDAALERGRWWISETHSWEELRCPGPTPAVGSTGSRPCRSGT